MPESELLLTRASWTKGRETGRRDAEEEAQASSGSRRERTQSRVESHGRGLSCPVGEPRQMTTVVGRTKAPQRFQAWAPRGQSTLHRNQEPRPSRRL